MLSTRSLAVMTRHHDRSLAMPLGCWFRMAHHRRVYERRLYARIHAQGLARAQAVLEGWQVVCEPP